MAANEAPHTLVIDLEMARVVRICADLQAPALEHTEFVGDVLAILEREYLSDDNARFVDDPTPISMPPAAVLRRFLLKGKPPPSESTA